MKRIGIDGEIKEHDYKEWPIFRELRKRPEFLASYQEIFGKPFAPTERIVSKLNKQLTDLKVDYVWDNGNVPDEVDPGDYSI